MCHKGCNDGGVCLDWGHKIYSYVSLILVICFSKKCMQIFLGQHILAVNKFLSILFQGFEKENAVGGTTFTSYCDSFGKHVLDTTDIRKFDLWWVLKNQISSICADVSLITL